MNPHVPVIQLQPVSAQGHYYLFVYSLPFSPEDFILKLIPDIIL